MLLVQRLQGQCIWVPHLSLIQISGISLLLIVNQDAVRRIMVRSQKLAAGIYPGIANLQTPGNAVD